MAKIFLIWISGIGVLLAGEPGDSAHSYNMNDVIVTGIHFKKEVRLSPSSVIVITPVQLNEGAGTSVASMIKDIPSVFVRGYGGNGSLQTISMRGMGAEYTNILIDGEQFTSAQNALVDLGIFLTDDVAQIEIAKGGYSSAVGSNAISGVVNIVTKKPTKEIHASIASMIGSFNTQSNSLSLSGGGDAIRIKTLYSVERARNDYQFLFNDGLQNYNLNRTGADYSINNTSISIISDVTDSLQTLLSLRYSLAERGSPSGVTSPYQSNLTRLKDNNLFVTSSTQWILSSQTTVHANGRFNYYQQNYHNPNNIDFKGRDTYSVQRIEGISFLIDHMLDDENTLSGGAEASRAEVQGSDLKFHMRSQGALYLSSEHRIVDPIDLVLYPSIRVDGYENVNYSISPKIGTSIQITDNPEVRLRGSISRNFRIPTFNELYWVSGGNPNLSPEKSISGDAGILLEYHTFGEWNAEINYFMIDTKDRIIWIPGAVGIWTPQNVNRVLSSGVELAIHHTLPDDYFQWNVSYSFMNVLRKDAAGMITQLHNKQLPYTPFDMGSGSIQWNSDPVTVSIHHSFTGFRYINENNDPKFILPAFQVTDIVLLANISFNNFLVTLKTEARNIFNTQYQWIPAYPVPGRNFSLSCSLHI